MIVNTKSDSNVITSAKSKSFGFEINGKAFKALFSDIYTNKIGSVVREIGSNCRDAHVDAGCHDVPFEIEVYSGAIDASYIEFTDYGIGMSSDTIEKLYTSFFSSSKDQDNEAIGGFGIGSKSPLAYTDSFTVTSIKDGYKNVAMITKQDNMPKYKLLVKDVPVESRNSTIVRIPIDKQDVQKFVYEIYEQLRYLPVLPIVKTNVEHNYKFPTFDYVGPGYKIEKNKPSGITLCIGGIGYQLNRRIRGIFNDCHLVLDIPIGALEVTLSRESYVQTKESDEIVDAQYLHAATDFEKKLLEWSLDKDWLINNFKMAFLFAPENFCMTWSNKSSAQEYSDNLCNALNITADPKEGIYTYAFSGFFSIASSDFLSKKKLSSIANTLAQTINVDKRNRQVRIIVMDKFPKLANLHGAITRIYNELCRKFAPVMLICCDDRSVVKPLIDSVTDIFDITYTDYKSWKIDLGIKKPASKTATTRVQKKFAKLPKTAVIISKEKPYTNIKDYDYDSGYIDLSIFDENDLVVFGRNSKRYNQVYVSEYVDLHKDLFGKKSKCFFASLNQRGIDTVHQLIKDESVKCKIKFCETDDELYCFVNDTYIPELYKDRNRALASLFEFYDKDCAKTDYSIAIVNTDHLYGSTNLSYHSGYYWNIRSHILSREISGEDDYLEPVIKSEIENIKSGLKGIKPYQIKNNLFKTRLYVDFLPKIIGDIKRKILDKYPEAYDIMAIFKLYLEGKLNG